METHDFLLGKKSVDVVADLRDGIESLPETAATFSKARVVDNPRSLKPEYFDLVNSWEVPEFAYTGNRPRYVNPTHPEAIRYSDIMTKCKCGAIMWYPHEREVIKNVQVEHNNCPVYDRLQARAELAQKRAQIIRTGLRLGHSVNYLTDRIGLPYASHAPLCERLCIDVQGEAERGKQMIANTSAILLKERSPEVIGRAYGVHPDTITRYVTNYTEYDSYDIFQHRRWGKPI